MAAYVRDTGKFRGSGVASINGSFASLPASGNMVAVGITNYNDGGVAGAVAEGEVTDNQSNTYLRAVQSTAASGDHTAACIHYDAVIGSPSGTFTITIDPPGTNYLVAVGIEYTGLLDSTPLDKTQTNNGTSTTPTSGTTAALASADQIVIAVCAIGGTDTTAGIDTPATTGYTNRCVEQDANTYGGHSTDDKEVAATTAVSAAWGTLDGSYPWSACIATFELASGGGATTGAPILWGNILGTSPVFGGMVVR